MPVIARAIADSSALRRHALGYLGAFDCNKDFIVQEVLKVMPKEETNVMTVARQWMEAGMAEGVAEGKVEGKAEGKAELLLKMLRHRFGSIPRAIERRIEEAGAAFVEACGLRILDARSLDEVLGEAVQRRDPIR